MLTGMIKTKEAMIKIEAILKEYNLGAIVVLHTPGYVEYAQRLDPTYSCINQDGNRMSYRLRLKEDYGGSTAAMNERITDTLDMLTALTHTTGAVIIPIGQQAIKLNAIIDQAKKDDADK